jgi:hypothetical protein
VGVVRGVEPGQLRRTDRLSAGVRAAAGGPRPGVVVERRLCRTARPHRIVRVGAVGLARDARGDARRGRTGPGTSHRPVAGPRRGAFGTDAFDHHAPHHRRLRDAAAVGDPAGALPAQLRARVRRPPPVRQRRHAGHSAPDPARGRVRDDFARNRIAVAGAGRGGAAVRGRGDASRAALRSAPPRQSPADITR